MYRQSVGNYADAQDLPDAVFLFFYLPFHSYPTTEPLLYQSLLLPYNTLSLLIIIKAHHLSFSQGQAEPTLPILFRPIQIPVSSCLLLSFLQSDAIFLIH